MAVSVPAAKLERPLKALANKRRLLMVQLIKKRREATVGEIADTLRLSFKATSKHLGILVAADIVEREQRSLHAYYTLSPNPPAPIRSLISTL